MTAEVAGRNISSFEKPLFTIAVLSFCKQGRRLNEWAYCTAAFVKAVRESRRIVAL